MNKKNLSFCQTTAMNLCFFISHRFKKFKIKLISHIDISSDENDKSSLLFN